MNKQEEEWFNTAAKMCGINLYEGDWDKYLTFAMLYEYWLRESTMAKFSLDHSVEVKTKVEMIIDNLAKEDQDDKD